MNKLTKAFSAILASTMMLSLASCAPAAPSSTPPASDSASVSASASTPESTPASTPAPAGEIVKLKWATVGNGMPPNYKSWEAAMNKYLGEKIGVNIEMEVSAWGDWDTRRSVIVNTSADMDIVFTNLNTFVPDVKLGAFADISEIVKTASPELYKSMPQNYWDAASVDGKIYAVPTFKDSSQSEFFVYDTKLAKDAGVDTKSIKTLADLTPALKAMTEKSGKPAFKLYKEGPAWVHFEYDNLNSGLMPLGVRYDDAAGKVVSVFEQPDIMESLKLFHEWYKAGYINADAATAADDGLYKAVSIAQGWSGAAKTSWGPNMGVEAEAYQWKESIVSNDTVRGSMNCITTGCKNPEKALEFLQLVNTDPVVRNMFYYGEEGVDFSYNADGKIHRIQEGWAMPGYTQGSFFIVGQLDDVDFNQWDEVKVLNENAKPSVALGFTFDTTKVADKLANCTTVYLSYRGELTTGTKDPVTTVPAMMKELRAAGFDDIVAEAQTQLTAFLAAKK